MMNSLDEKLEAKSSLRKKNKMRIVRTKESSNKFFYFKGTFQIWKNNKSAEKSSLYGVAYAILKKE